MGCSRAIQLVLVLAAGIASSNAFAGGMNKSEANRIIPEGEYLVKNGQHVRANRSRLYASNTTDPKKKKTAPSKHPAKKFVHAKRARSTHRTTAQSRSVSGSRPIAHSHSNGHPARRLAGKSSKKSARRSSKRGGRATAHRGSRPATRHAAKPSPKTRRFPVARETPNERDMPFVSIPHRRVGHADRTIVMEDPAVKSPLPKPRREAASLKPDGGVLDPASEGPPSAVGAAKAAAEPSVPVAGPAPASVTEPGVAAPEAIAPVADTSEAAVAHNAANSASHEPDAFDLHSGQDPIRGP